MPIQVLSPQVANKIAAGEVVERPASVVKELVENAIDAGATEIHIEVRQGGRRLIRVSDDGCGIPFQEAALAFARHATSKISSEGDLERITTLGFRGEALASIGAVSHVTMLSRAESEATGISLRLEGGEIVQSEGHGGRQGTTITVENLFYNTPARLKFLRAEATESSHIVELVSAYAMAYPGLRFHLTDNSRLVLQTPGNGKLFDVLVKTLGLQTAQQMIELAAEKWVRTDDATGAAPGAAKDAHVGCVAGYVGSPSLHRATRNYQIFFVNRRWIQDRSLSFAVEEAYRTLLPTGRHPVAVLNITLDPGDVDVNVHPTKREVRFRDPRGAFAAVQRVVRHTIIGQSPVANLTGQPTSVPPTAWARPELPAMHHPETATQTERSQWAFEVQRTEETETPTLPGVPMWEQLPMLRVLGQVRQAYIIAEGPDGLYLIDQHAAHERVLYDQLQTEQSAMAVSTQALIEPLTVEIPTQQQSLLTAMLDALAGLGFDIAPFGGGSYLVRAIPAALSPDAVHSVLAELLEAAQEDKEPTLSAQHTLAIIACHSAVRAGQTLTLDESRELVRQLEKTTSPYTCPHGRPTMIHLSSVQLERSFGRR